jgi:phage portal protein BeeE
VLTTDYDLIGVEAEEVLEIWKNSGGQHGPRIATGGFKWEEGSKTPDDSQWVDSYSAGIVDVANMLGIPPPLLSASILGGNSSIVYQNLSDIFGEWWRQTLQPTFASLIEDAFTTLVPRGQTASFDPDDLIRPDLETRVDIAIALHAAGIIDTDEARRAVGYTGETSEVLTQRTTENAT